MSVPIPITLVLGALPPVSVGLNEQQYAQLIVDSIQATISEDVSFFYSGSIAPNHDVGLWFQTPQGVLHKWDAALGKYVPSTSYNGANQGDIKLNFTQADNYGWFSLDGRTITSISGSNSQQRSALTAMFGTVLPVMAGPTYTIAGGNATPAYYQVYVGFYDVLN